MLLMLAQTAGALPTSGPAGLQSDPRVVMWRSALFWGVIIFFVFLVAALAIVRFSERYRRYLAGRTNPPTPSEDVWKMHKLPKDED